MAPPMHFKQQQSQQQPSQPQPQLHNFALPALRWATTTNSSPSSSSRYVRRLPDFKSALVGDDACSADEAEESKKKFVIRLKTKNTNNVSMEGEVVEDGVDEKVAESEDCVVGEKEREAEEEEAGEEEEEEPPMRVWNLRPRKATMKANWRQHDNNASEGAVITIMTIERTAVREIKDSAKKVEKKKLSVSLSKNEIENDFVAMTGSKPSRKPHKRSKCLQRKIDHIYPGKWLSSVTPDTYKVNDREPRLKV